MTHYSLPLFPLNIVMFPGGVLPLRIFEMRYLDMVRACLRNNTAFGLIASLPEDQSNSDAGLPFFSIGTTLIIKEAGVTQVGLMNIFCRGQTRFHIHSAHQQKDGLWIGEVEDIKNESSVQIPGDLQSTGEFLKQLVESLVEQGVPESGMPFSEPYKFDDCAWVSSRWCEILPLPLLDKQRMLELHSPLVRLELINDWIQDQFAKGQA